MATDGLKKIIEMICQRCLILSLVSLLLVHFDSLAGGTLRYGIKHQVDNFDPHSIISDMSTIVLGELYTGLMTHAANGTVIPGCAKRWSISADHKTLTFYLRDNLRWSDGHPLTAGDFELSFRRLFRINNQDAEQYAAIAGADALRKGQRTPSHWGVKALDDKTLEITLDHPAPLMIDLMAYISAAPVPSHKIQQLGNDWSQPQHLVSNGPFIFRSQGPHQLTLVKNAHFYEADKVSLDSVMFITPQARQSMGRMIIHGQLDVADNLSFNQYQYISLHSPELIRTHANWSTYWYALNHQDPRFKDIRVRRALYMAVDRDAIVRSFDNGITPAFAMVPEDLLPRAIPPGTGNHSHDLLQARALMEKAGYNSNNKLHLEIKTWDKRQEQIVAAITSRSWSKIHVKTTIVNVDPLKHWRELRKGNYTVGRLGWLVSYPSPANFLNNFIRDAGFNNEHWVDPEYDRLLHGSARETNPEKRKKLLQHAHQRLLDQVVNIPLYHGLDQNLVNLNVHGWKENQRGVHPCRWLRLDAVKPAE